MSEPGYPTVWITVHADTQPEASAIIQRMVKASKLFVMDEGLADAQPEQGVLVQACCMEEISHDHS